MATGSPFPVELEVRLLTSARAWEPSIFDLDFSDGLTFAPTGQVFVLPAGFDANGTGIVGNQWIQGPPTAAFSVTPVNSDCGTAVRFDGSASTAPPGRTIVRYLWDYDDGSGVESTTGPTVDHAFGRLGLLHPTLTVQDDLGLVSDAATTTARSLDRGAPTAVVTGPAIANLGATVTFDGSGSSDPEAGCGSRLVEWTWSLDGGAAIVTDTPTIDSSRFGALASGPHTVHLVVTDDSGNQSAPADFGFRVVVRPTAILRSSPLLPSCGQTVAFDGSASFADPTLQGGPLGLRPGRRVGCRRARPCRPSTTPTPGWAGSTRASS